MRSRVHKKSVIWIIIGVVIYMVLLTGLAVFFTSNSRSRMEEMLKHEMVDVAKSAAASIDGDVLDEIVDDNKNTESFKTIYDRLSIFLNKTNARYIYAVRKMNGDVYSFVLDTDPNDPAFYGEPIERTDELVEAYQGTPSVEADVHSDRWGHFYTAYCPVYNSAGTVCGVIGADFEADWYQDELSVQRLWILIICISTLIMSVFVVVLVLNMSKREAMEKARERDELQVAKAEAYEANMAKNKFLEKMSYEVRTPIDRIMSMDEMILRESVERDVRESANHIRHAGNELLALMDEILDMSMIESEESEVMPVRYDPVLLVSDLTEIMQTRLREKDIEVYTEIDDKIPSILLGDLGRIKKCLLNLLTNSIKFTEKGEIHLSMKRERIRGTTVWIRFAVYDTGVGIAVDEIKLLYEAIEDFGKMDKTAVEGTSLSLGIVHRVLKAMDSSLEIESKVGQGSTFSFVLKQKVVDEKPIGDYERAREVMISELKGGEAISYTAPDARILVVDDSKMDLKVVARILKDLEVMTDTTDSGARAMELMSINTYDALIIDHLMPEMDGIELLRLIRENTENPNCNKPCIVLTGNTIDGAREEYLKVGFDAYIAKPVENGLLESVLYRYLPPDKIKTDRLFVKRQGV